MTALHRIILLALITFSILSTNAIAEPAIAKIATWRSDAKAVFLLMFDDSWPSHFEVAVPELVKRDMIATFYINAGKGEYKVHRKKWEEEVWKTGMVYGNHTMTHQGVKNYDHAVKEIGDCTDAILAIGKGKKPRLVSFAMPGVGPGKWNITGDELKKILKEQNLIDRPPFAGHGAVYHWKTADQMLALADKAIALGGMEYLVIHGVERRAPMNTTYQDFWPLNQDVYRTVLDGLKERRDRGDLWITDHISYHQYLTQRTSASVQAVSSSDNEVRLKLTCQADPELYDGPLTLIATVPPAWSQCHVVQGESKSTVDVRDGVARFDALPNGPLIVLTPAEPDRAAERPSK